MKKLSKKMINKMIMEEVEYHKSRKLWESKKPKLKAYRQKMLSLGHDKKRVDENILSMISGLAQRGIGLGGAEYFDPESESIFGGISGGVRTAIEQSVLEAVVKKFGFDPYKGFGLTLKNALERVIRKYSNEELQELFTQEGCSPLAFEIAKETIIIIEESEKERVLGFAMASIGGQFGEDFKKSKLTKGIYQNIREKFSEAFDDLINEDEIAKSLAEIICETFSMEEILDFVKGTAGSAIDTTFGEFSNALSDIYPFNK